jgi:hypothetical protein
MHSQAALSGRVGFPAPSAPRRSPNVLVAQYKVQSSAPTFRIKETGWKASGQVITLLDLDVTGWRKLRPGRHSIWSSGRPTGISIDDDSTDVQYLAIVARSPFKS